MLTVDLTKCLGIDIITLVFRDGRTYHVSASVLQNTVDRLAREWWAGVEITLPKEDGS